jgi:hypothetical protein
MDSVLAKECFHALVRHHQARIGQGHLGAEENRILKNLALEQQGTSHQNIRLSGQEIGTRFALEATRKLDGKQLQQLLQFLHASPETMASQSKDELHKTLLRRLNEFYAAEPRESGECASRLTKPSGPVDAELGIILHCQTKKGKVGCFWDQESPTIQALAKKGFSNQFAFCYDWHWRAEETLRGRGLCPTIRWKKSLKSLHNNLSTCLLSMLNFRLLIVGGSCAKTHYRNVPSTGRQALLVPLIPGLELELDLEFTNQSLRRIVAYLDHPSAIYFNNTTGFTASSLKLDAGSNFFLWLLGRPHDSVAIQSLFDERGFRRPTSAPLSDMWGDLRREKILGQTLLQKEYNGSFLNWSRNFLAHEFAAIVERRDSIAGACAVEVERRALNGRKRAYYTRLEEQRPTKKPNQSKDRNTLLRKQINELRDGEDPFQQSSELGIGHDKWDNGQRQQQDADVYQEMQIDPPLTPCSSKTQPSSLLRSEPGVDCKNGNPAVVVPLQSHLTYEEHRLQLNRELNYQRYGNVIREFWDGHEVKIQSNEIVRLFITSGRSALQLRTSKSAAARMRRIGNRVSIHFTPDEITFMVTGEIVYRKSAAALENGNNGKEWARQIEKEMIKKRSTSNGR